MASGTGDGAIVLWDLGSTLSKDQQEPSEEKKRFKKRKVEVGELAVKKELPGMHTMEVTDMQFVGMTQLLSASYDHSIKLVDLTKGEATVTIHAPYAGVCSIDSFQNTVFAGLTDCTVRQWDTREATQSRVYAGAHTAWVSSVAINPLNRNVVVSAGYDGKVMVWDVRGSKKPLQKICLQKDKVMAAGWNGAQKIVSGGCEGQIYVHSLQFGDAE